MIIHFKKQFKKSLSKFHKKIQIKAKRTICSFTDNPFLKELNNHALKGEYLGMRSINVTGDIRIILVEHNNYELVEILDIGTHSKLY